MCTPGTTPGPAELLDRAEILPASIAARMREAGLRELAAKIETCGTEDLAFQCRNCGRIRFSTNRCNSRWCPTCSRRIAAIRADTIRIWIRTLKQPKHVVLTVRNSHIFNSAYVQAFKISLTRLRRHRWQPTWEAGTWTLEVTNEGRGYHLHAHLLIETRWIDPELLARRWARLVSQDFAICKIRDARESDYAAEVAKYIAKPAQIATWPPNELGRIVRGLEGHRVFGVFGSLYRERANFTTQIRQLRQQRGACECGCRAWDWIPPLEAETGLRFR